MFEEKGVIKFGEFSVRLVLTGRSASEASGSPVSDYLPLLDGSSAAPGLLGSLNALITLTSLCARFLVEILVNSTIVYVFEDEVCSGCSGMVISGHFRIGLIHQ